MAIFSVFQVVSILTLSLYLVGFMNNLFTDRENACEMTYMYEYPQFVRIHVDKNDVFPQYGLYAYSEGRFTERARKMRFDGIPVLFLPGHMGSHKQVRSLASVALRKSLPSSKYGFHFDYFSIDFNQEISGLFGGVLKKQSKFTSHCLLAILQLYESNFKNKPTSIIVIGHSMGGVIAQSLLNFPENRNLIDLVITLATPHEAPVLSIDYYFKNIYDDVHNTWDLLASNSTNADSKSNKILVSIGGGERDHLVPSALTSSRHGNIKTLTTAIPGVWLSTDHLCIVWCKQLILVLNRFLFSIIDTKTKQLSSDSTHIVTMGRHYIQAGYSKNYSHYQLPAEFIPDANWHEDSRRAYSFKHEKTTKTWYYMVRLMNFPDNEAVTFQVIDLEDNDWLFGCQAKYVHGQNRVCLTGRHLSQFGKWGASRTSKRKIATLDLHSLHASYPHWTHILLRISPTYKPVQIHVDIYNKNSRQIQAVLPSMYSLARRTIIKETETSAIRYNITLTGLEMLYQAYLLYVEPLESCQIANHHAVAELVVPWADGHEYHSFFTELQKSPMRIRLHKGNPNLMKNHTQYPNIILTLDPQCRYSISIAVSPYDALGQLSRYYTTSLPAYLAAILLLVLRNFAVNMNLKKSGASFHSALCGEYVKPYYFLLIARLGIMGFMTVPFLNKISSSLSIGSSASQNFLLLPLLLYLIALGITHILGAICWGFLIFSGQIAHRILIRLVSAGKTGSGGRFWEWLTKEIGNIPGFGGFILIVVSTASCGAAALAIGAAFYFFLLTKMYEDYLENFIYKAIAKVAKKISKMTSKKTTTKSEDTKTNEDNKELVKVDENEDNDKSALVVQDKEVPKENKDKIKEKNRQNDESLSLCSLHFHFSMFFVWCLVTILNIPTLLTWAHNFKYSRMMEMDPSYYPSLVMSACAFSLWQLDVPKTNLKYYDVIDKIIYVTAIATIIIAPMSLYRLNYILCSIFAIITIHQMLPFKEETNDNQSDEDTKDEKDEQKINNDTGEEMPTSSSTVNDDDDAVVEKLDTLKEKLKFE